MKKISFLLLVTTTLSGCVFYFDYHGDFFPTQMLKDVGFYDVSTPISSLPFTFTRNGGHFQIQASMTEQDYIDYSFVLYDYYFNHDEVTQIGLFTDWSGMGFFSSSTYTYSETFDWYRTNPENDFYIAHFAYASNNPSDSPINDKEEHIIRLTWYNPDVYELADGYNVELEFGTSLPAEDTTIEMPAAISS